MHERSYRKWYRKAYVSIGVEDDILLVDVARARLLDRLMLTLASNMTQNIIQNSVFTVLRD